jgi:prepilin-type N-terminal cleavage/methylation domain-containing protein
MSRFFKKQGFTLIELMVVIVIIGVLASLAIPRFTEASAKAKIAEAPRVLASYESAFLAATAELPPASVPNISGGDLVFETPTDSKWFTYNADTPNKCFATAQGKIGTFVGPAAYLLTTYNSNSATFTHTAGADASAVTAANKMVPNFMKQVTPSTPTQTP